MERKKASDFPPEVLKLFDGYIHGMVSRRDFLNSAAKFAVGGITAAAMLESLTPNYALGSGPTISITLRPRDQGPCAGISRGRPRAASFPVWW